VLVCDDDDDDDDDDDISPIWVHVAHEIDKREDAIEAATRLDARHR
jgi:hypothetical protein